MNHEAHEHQHQGMHMSYGTFAAMIATAMVVMYGFTYLNTYEFSHVRWSETRLYMTLMMGAAMAVIMLSFMRGMYRNKQLNLAIYLGSVAVFLIALFLLRSQTLVGDSSYMRAMIPHHSIAILTSENAGIEDVRVRELADEIMATQRREIAEMNWLLDDIAENGIASTQAEAEARPVPEFEGFINRTLLANSAILAILFSDERATRGIEHETPAVDSVTDDVDAGSLRYGR